MAPIRGTTVLLIERRRCRCSTRRKKSAAQARKMVIEASWKIIPATIISVPGLVSLLLFDSDEAIPPPMAWTTREITSQVQNIHRYMEGLSTEDSRPNI